MDQVAEQLIGKSAGPKKELSVHQNTLMADCSLGRTSYKLGDDNGDSPKKVASVSAMTFVDDSSPPATEPSRLADLTQRKQGAGEDSTVPRIIDL